MQSPPTLDSALLETSFVFDSAHPHEQRMLLRETPGVSFTETRHWFLWWRFVVTVPTAQAATLRAQMHALEAEESFSRDW